MDFIPLWYIISKIYHPLPFLWLAAVRMSVLIRNEAVRIWRTCCGLLLKTLTIDGCFYRCVYATVLYRLFFLVFSISLPSCNCITKQCVTPAGSGSVFCYCQPVNWIQNWNRIKWSALWCERVVLWGLNAARGCEALCALHGWSFFWCSSFRFAPTTVLTFPSPLSAAHLLIS